MIPLEDLYTDIIGKAQRGLGLTDAGLQSKTGLSQSQLAELKAGQFNEAALRAVAQALHLGTEPLLASARQAWRPASVTCSGLAQFNTVFEDMTVNAYLVWDETHHEAVAFDTGADAGPLLEFAKRRRLQIKYILITHTHDDHVADLSRLARATGAPAYVGNREPQLDGTNPFEAGKSFQVGALQVETRLTWGHAQGGITYVVRGLARPIAVVGDAIFAGSMGGGAVSYTAALRTNREEILALPPETILCPGHGPLTTVGEELQHNPFFTGESVAAMPK
jgi:hydroxyacylglutathione hydrolase